MVTEAQASFDKAREAVRAVASKMQAMAVEAKGFAADVQDSITKVGKAVSAGVGEVKKTVKKKAVVKKAKATVRKPAARAKKAVPTRTSATRNAVSGRGRVAGPAVRKEARKVARKAKPR